MDPGQLSRFSICICTKCATEDRRGKIFFVKTWWNFTHTHTLTHTHSEQSYSHIDIPLVTYSALFPFRIFDRWPRKRASATFFLGYFATPFNVNLPFSATAIFRTICPDAGKFLSRESRCVAPPPPPPHAANNVVLRVSRRENPFATEKLNEGMAGVEKGGTENERERECGTRMKEGGGGGGVHRGERTVTS